jgi:hypothetical protein
MRLWYFAVPIFLAAGYLSLARLDNTVFWDDEADTAIVAKNLVKTGCLPTETAADWTKICDR